MSNLPVDWRPERLDHHCLCRSLCDEPLRLVVSTDDYECDNGHTDHECNCDDLAEVYGEYAADAYAEYLYDKEP